MCDPILTTLLKMRHHYSQSSRENAYPSRGTSPLAPYKEVHPPGNTVEPPLKATLHNGHLSTLRPCFFNGQSIHSLLFQGSLQRSLSSVPRVAVVENCKTPRNNKVDSKERCTIKHYEMWRISFLRLCVIELVRLFSVMQWSVYFSAEKAISRVLYPQYFQNWWKFLGFKDKVFELVFRFQCYNPKKYDQKSV